MAENSDAGVVHEKPKRRKRTVRLSRDLKALRAFVQSLETQTPAERRAAILWLVDYYGIQR